MIRDAARSLMNSPSFSLFDFFLGIVATMRPFLVSSQTFRHHSLRIYSCKLFCLLFLTPKHRYFFSFLHFYNFSSFPRVFSLIIKKLNLFLTFYIPSHVYSFFISFFFSFVIFIIPTSFQFNCKEA